MSDAEEQINEIEVLKSIYLDEEFYKQISPKRHHFKFGPQDGLKSFVLQIDWPEDYPTTSGVDLSLDLFYNAHLLPDVKMSILTKLNEQAIECLGTPATFTIVEFVKDNLDDLLKDQTDVVAKVPHIDSATDIAENADDELEDQSTRVRARQALSKAQKRKLWDKSTGGQVDSRDRGWNWVDLIRHLSQTGPQT